MKHVWIVLADGVPEYGRYEIDDLDLIVERLTGFDAASDAAGDKVRESLRRQLTRMPFGREQIIGGHRVIRVLMLDDVDPVPPSESEYQATDRFCRKGAGDGPNVQNIDKPRYPKAAQFLPVAAALIGWAAGTATDAHAMEAFMDAVEPDDAQQDAEPQP